MGKIYRNNGRIKTKEKTDSLTHPDHTSRRRLNESDVKNRLNKDDSSDALSSWDGQNEAVNQDHSKNHDESPNHTDKKKCPYCDYEEQPFFIKVHVKYTHLEQRNDSI